jgi:DNA-binding transcriptional MerR regulator
VIDEAQKHSFLRSGELARRAGVSADTLRHYERKGLLDKPRRSRNGYREYPLTALDRVQLIQCALEVGFTLDELAQIFKVRDRGGAPCQAVQSLAETKLAKIEEQLRALTVLRDDLRAMLNNWDARMATRRPGERAGLLEALAASRAPRREKKPAIPRAPFNRKHHVKE